MNSPGLNTQKCNNILITGATGFIGSHLLNRIRENNVEIHTINRNSISYPVPVHQYIGDIQDQQFVSKCVRESQPDIIFHLAASKERSLTINSFYESINTNILGTLNILSSATTLPSLSAIVVLGTAEEYGPNECPFSESMRERPVSPYSFSKMSISHLCEIFFNIYDLPVIVLRPTLAYGPGQGKDMFIPSLITTLLDDNPFDMTMGEQTRDFIYIADLVDAIVMAPGNIKALGQIMNIGSGIPMKLTDISEKIQKMLNKKGLVRIGRMPYRKNEVMNYYVDSKKAEQILGWKAKTSLKEGLNRTIAYYKGVKKG